MSNSFVPPPIPPKNDKFVPPKFPQKNAVPDCTEARQLQKPKKFKKRWAVLAAVGLLTACVALYISQINKNILIIQTNDDGYRVITGYEKIESGRLVIPKEKDGIIIGAEVFAKCEDITSVTILGNTVIYPYAFMDCDNLTEVTMKGKGIVAILEGAFSGCTNLSKIGILERAVFIGDVAFHGCTNLTEVVIPETVERIGYFAFGNCTNLAKVTIREGVEHISANAFDGCTNLTEVVIPEKFRNDLESIFSGCDLASINFKFT